MGSGIIYYEYEKPEKFKYYDMKANAELGTFKIRHCHFDGESFVNPLHSVRFDPDRTYEVPIEALMADQPFSSSKTGKSSARGSHPSRRWMLEGDEEEKEIGGMEPSVEKEGVREEEEDDEDPEEEDPEEEVPVSTSLPMDIDATENYL
ncbi:hypothetical protein PIB30_081667 [Stylosanthes scabra]|uniref:Uncharacterized protein n=1 Tax=Stylosanthes scabra TaxID=79078 RepID=A0ABU6UU39_9FABA|nr:hypothetical protein [Stylosanthes scabra]